MDFPAGIIVFITKLYNTKNFNSGIILSDVAEISLSEPGAATEMCFDNLENKEIAIIKEF